MAEVRQDNPDYVLLWGWGVMNSDRHQGSGRRRLSARQDDRRVVVGRRARRDPAGDDAKGYKALSFSTAGKFKVHEDI